MSKVISQLSPRAIFLENWIGKLVSLLISLAIWYLIHSNLERPAQDFPVPGTGDSTQPQVTPPLLDESILTPLAPPVPGSTLGPVQQ